ncbi:unnamed protein product [Arabidopsis thaliana]|uniref:DUF674 family protein n=1 Tax=Arabidopsis thaliana TaxID=3702 RepID=A0A654F5G8_ARATH|nr:unnamed protein product [Arabidopsis thaliana]
MAKSEKISLKLLVDEKKNKVVLAEAGQDFVDVLFGLLTFPMGTIARLLEKHQKLPQILGCYKNLSRSVSDMAVDDFKTEACKSMLLSPKSSMEIHCRRLKLHIDDTQATMFYVCSKKHESDSCKYSNFYKSRCSCGSLMIYQIHVPEDEQVVDSLGNAEDVVFVSCRSSFILTDDLKVMLNSIDEIVKVLNGLGYPNINDLKEMLIDVGSEEVLSLLGNLFTSESALTSTFLMKQCMTTMLTLSPPPMFKTGRVEQGSGCLIKVFVGKLDRKILYAECSEDFIDSLLTFLVLPLESASSFFEDNTIIGCVKNLSFELSVLGEGQKVVTLNPIDPKTSKSCTSVVADSGFVKRNTKFIVSDDLIITPMNKFSTIGLLKKMQINMNDFEAQSICIYKAELVNILRASLTSSSALTNVLSNLLAKEPKKES